jgi:hypothetical protein
MVVHASTLWNIERRVDEQNIDKRAILDDPDFQDVFG